MSKRLGIPKSFCKKYVQELKDEGIVTQEQKVFFRKTRIFLSTNPERVQELISSHAHV